MNFDNGAQFDPGFVQHMSAFVPNIEYIYAGLNRLKNFTLKKNQFKMYYPKIQSLLKNYLGFYLGCILWAAYISQLDEKPILNNLCFGGEYSEKETLSEVDFILDYIEQLKKDVKYYTGQDFTIDENSINILNAYREFLIANKGFVETKTTKDIKLPTNLKTPSDKDLEEILSGIEKVIDNGKLYELFPLAQKVL
ncbi:unknown [Clostridium sp. CAG:768]|nr:unknown [Clostridium sp. CAG:768]